MTPMLPGLATLVVYGSTASLALWLAHRFVVPIPRRTAVILGAAPLLFTGQAILTRGILAPLDIVYQAEPFRSIASQEGIGPTRDPLLVDVVAQMLPWRAAVRESLAAGRFPLWNRHVLSGEPLLGVAQPAIFHPGTWVGLLLPLPEAWNFDVSLRLLLALGCAYVFFRGIGAEDMPALLGAFAWGFSDFLLFYVGYPITPSLAPFPLLLLGLTRLARGGGTAEVALTVTALVLTIVSGHPETLLFGVTGAGLFFLVELARARPGDRGRAIGLSLLSGAIALGMCAVVLLPFLEILPQTWQHSLRMLPRSWGDRSAPLAECLRRLVPSLVPYAYGTLGRTRVVERLILPAGYAGALLFPLAAAGSFGKDRRRWSFLLLAALGLALNVRLPGIAGPLSKLPLFEIAFNDYFVFLVVFGLSGLAVLGTARLQRGEGAAAFLRGAAASAVVLSAVVATRSARLEDLGMTRAYLAGRFLLQAVPLGLGALIVVVGVRRRRLGVGAVIGLLVLFVGARRLEEAQVYPTCPVGALAVPLRLLDPIPRGEPVRMAALGRSFEPNVAAFYGVEDVRGYDAMTLKRYADTYGLWCTQLPAYFNLVDDPTSAFEAFLGVRYVLVPPGMKSPEGWRVLAEERGSRLVENPKALRRAFAPAHVAWVGDESRALAVTLSIPDFAVDGVAGRARPGPLGWLPNGPADVSVAGYGPDSLALSIRSAAPVFVGTSVTAWKGWTLALDGQDRPLVPYNHAFLGFEAPAGRHEAVLRYRPDGFVRGAAVSAATVVLCSAAGLGRRRRRARGPGASPPA